MFIDFREREREREKHQCERETSIKPTTQVYGTIVQLTEPGQKQQFLITEESTNTAVFPHNVAVNAFRIP